MDSKDNTQSKLSKTKNEEEEKKETKNNLDSPGPSANLANSFLRSKHLNF